MEPASATCPSLWELVPPLSGRQLCFANRCLLLVVHPDRILQAAADGGNFVIVLPPAYFMTLMTEDALLDYFRLVYYPMF